MRDDKRKITVDGAEYTIDRTFDDSPAIYKAAKKRNIYINIKSKNDEDRGFHIQSLLEGFEDDDCVIIFARKSN